MKINSQHHKNPRSGFTLLELIAVVAVIAILMALLLPVLQGILGTGNEAAVTADLTQLDQALTSFKTKFGDYPPSSLTIPAAGGTWGAKDRAAVKSFWPQFDFSTNGGLGNSSALNLSGAECLVFFLGGIESGTIDAPVLAGFSKNPLTPWTASGNADGPFMEFDFSRIADVDGDGLFEYLDAMPDQSTPIMYVSAAGGRYNKTTDSGSHDDYDVFGDDDPRNLLGCYMQADGSTPQRKDSFQLISPGEDGEYGEGGAYSPDDELTGTRQPEVDNITSFSSGTLN